MQEWTYWLPSWEPFVIMEESQELFRKLCYSTALCHFENGKKCDWLYFSEGQEIGKIQLLISLYVAFIVWGPITVNKRHQM